MQYYVPFSYEDIEKGIYWYGFIDFCCRKLLFDSTFFNHFFHMKWLHFYCHELISMYLLQYFKTVINLYKKKFTSFWAFLSAVIIVAFRCIEITVIKIFSFFYIIADLFCTVYSMYDRNLVTVMIQGLQSFRITNNIK